MITEKKPLKKIFCRFHQQIDCTCVYPIVNTQVLIERLKYHIRLNKNLNRYERDEKSKEKRNQETISLENRLSDLKE